MVVCLGTECPPISIAMEGGAQVYHTHTVNNELHVEDQDYMIG